MAIKVLVTGAGGFIGHHLVAHRVNQGCNLNTLDAAFRNGVRGFLYFSSACIYLQYLQRSPGVSPLAEHTAWPADPKKGYGLEKLYMEKMCQYYREDLGFGTRVARFHNVYGPLGTWNGGREKAPAAICRKVARSSNSGKIEIRGDGRQTSNSTEALAAKA